MEENHIGWKLVRGVRKDVVNLFKLFAKTNSVRYEDFCKVWKELSFSLIFSNRIVFNELVEFTEELLQIVKEYLLSVYEFHTRVAALYTLYGLYFKQPIKGAAKIRFTKSEWEEVQSLIENCKIGKHYDIVFIHLKLYLNGAYNFVATVRPAGLEFGFKKYYEKRSSNISRDVELLYRPLVSERLVNSLLKLEPLYFKKKSELLGKRNLVFIDGKFAQSLQEELKGYELQSQRFPGTNNKKDSKEKNEGRVEEEPNAKISRIVKTEKSTNKEKRENQTRQKGLQLQLLARKKAEFYIKKLKEENNPEGSSNVNLDLLELFDS